ncbi:dihydrolipoamide acetyltransferase family protein [Streptomyces sp. OM5714]|uniref:dihydrolipoamide acetyltransferase family protein n=1 Tax=Streptomyces sp. OM5714 TaxID=2602736 RepID=UPI001F094468|nr:dihydrolipoamide acetyltransferase family protein [Streptomyces sp. OM5714]
MPDVGEGLTEAEILRWYVSSGDPVHDGMTVCEVETAKAVVELPIPYDGTVHEIHFGEGTTVGIGAVIITVDTAPSGATDAEPPEPAEVPVTEGVRQPEPRQAVLVGYGVTDGPTRRRPRKPAAVAAGRPRRPGASDGGAVPAAKPPVRKLARDLGIDLARVTPTGPSRTITRADVHAALPAAQTPASAPPHPAAGERRIPVRGVRKAVAEAMVASAFTAPHVTEFLTVDVTRTMKLLRRLRREPDFTGVRVTPMLMVAKALLTAVGKHPAVNASWDEARGEIVLKDGVHLGVAAATPRGLVVPHIRDAHARTLPELARCLHDLVDTARAGKTAPADLSGSTVTITNIGVFGVDTGTPILNPGEAAILAVGAIRERPWVHRGRVVPRQVTTLALFFDHRLVDGELGSRVLTETAAVLERPKRLLHSL